MLTCNYLKKDFYDFCDRIAPYTAYLHLGDARGLNGEGLQIGDGEINFDKFGKILNKKFKNIAFIPEIWQGHKNQGKGFWEALNLLESKI
jgi:N-acetylneuraminate synthase